MNDELKYKLLLYWKMTGVFVEGVPINIEGLDIWNSILPVSTFRENIGFYTDHDKIYNGILGDHSYRINSISSQRLLNFMNFYYDQLGVIYKQIYFSNINVIQSKQLYYSRDSGTLAGICFG